MIIFYNNDDNNNNETFYKAPFSYLQLKFKTKIKVKN